MTTRTLSLAALAALALAPAACQRDHSDLGERLDRIESRLADIDRKLAAGAGVGAAAPRRERPRPNPATTYSIPVDSAPLKGAKDALVTVVEGFEFACPYCEQSRGLVDQILEAYPNDVRVAYKHFIVHPTTATVPALAACAAHRQGKFDAMEALIWDKGFKAGRNLGAENMEKLAAEAGLDVERFKADMNGAECKKLVREDQAQLARVGTGGTPTFYVNGRWLQRRSFDELKRLIDEELAKAKERVSAGTSRAAYYKEWVVDKGQKKL
ncbi:MAG TPA: thioredoxin domain-containing protein [Kofleriaceae bacterium]|nr:thioredoxin domain-containing protein [Kofleriaceae bacterium]